jgi:hypothetical protein
VHYLSDADVASFLDGPQRELKPMAFLRAFVRGLFFTKGTADVELRLLSERCGREEINDRVIPIRAIDNTEMLGQEMFRPVSEAVEDCLRCDPTWAAWVAARAHARRARLTSHCKSRSIEAAIDDIAINFAMNDLDPARTGPVDQELAAGQA